MKKQFTVFDVETANRNSASICSIGIVVVSDNVIIDEYYSLINPQTHFESGNIAVHGITSRDVASSPTFDQVWPIIRPYFEDQLVLAHYASFDIGALRGALKQYDIDHPIFTYSCTCVLGRKLLPESYNHKLNTLANYYGFTFMHHNALEDARVAGLIAIRYLESQGLDDMDELHKRFRVKYRNFIETKPKATKIPVPKPIFTKANQSHLLYRKRVCITGTLKEDRTVIYHRLALVGAYIDETVSVATDFLVSGFSKRPSTKLKTAQKLQDVSQLQIIDEDLFYTLLNYRPDIEQEKEESKSCGAEYDATNNVIAENEVPSPTIASPKANYVMDLRSLVGSRPLLVPGATILHFNEKQQLLFNYRSDTNNWGLPGGAMELKESIEDCARRELEEETGLLAHSLRMVHVFSGPDFYFRYPNGHEVYNMCVLFIASEVRCEPHVNDNESYELRYFGLDDLPEMESRAKLICEWISQHWEDIVSAV